MNKNKPFNFVLIGRSGSGKGTQAKFLMEHFGNLVPIVTGDLFRALMKLNTDVAKRVKKTVREGKLPYDDLATTLWMHKIASEVKEDEGILADGLPRRLSETKNFERLLEYLERKENTFVLLIDISREEAFNRLTKRRICEKCGHLIPWVGKFKELKICDQCGGELITRHDDVPEVINNRLDYYDNRVVEVVDYYKDQGRLIRINGGQSIEDVFKDILKAIK
jgi:adenylate kinase